MNYVYKTFAIIWTTMFTYSLSADGLALSSKGSIQKQPFINELLKAINETRLQKVVDLLNENVNTIDTSNINKAPFGKSPIEVAFEKAFIIKDGKMIALGNDDAVSILYLLVNCRADLDHLHDIIYYFLDDPTLEPKFERFASRALALKFQKMIRELHNTAAEPLCGIESKQSWLDWALSKLN